MLLVKSKHAQFFQQLDHVLTTNGPLQISIESVRTLVWSPFGAIAAFTPTQTNVTKVENELFFSQLSVVNVGPCLHVVLFSPTLVFSLHYSGSPEMVVKYFFFSGWERRNVWQLSLTLGSWLSEVQTVSQEAREDTRVAR